MAVSKAIDKPDAAIRGVRHVHSSKLHRVYEVVLSDGRTLELVMPPPSMLRLLRSERQIINSEAVVVQWLSTLPSEGSPTNPGSTQEKEDSSLDRAEGETSRSSGTSSQQRAAERGFPDHKSALLRLLPILVSRSGDGADLGAPYSIYEPRGGAPIASQPQPLTKHQRAEIDFQLGRLTRQFAEIKSPTGRFGHAVSVIAHKTPTHTKHGSRQPSPSSSGPVGGSRTWSAAFHLMFEGVLRDAEDMAIMLAYPIVRKHLVRLSYLLDEVTVPSLVFVDGMDDDNVLVASLPTRSSGPQGGQDSGRDSPDSDHDSSDKEEDKEKEENASAIDDAVQEDDQPSPTTKSSIKIAGLRDWSNGVFGDPLFAIAFSDNPSKELLDGFYGTTTGERSPMPNSELTASTKTRLLLYQAYHATVSIVTEFYRPWSESTTRELTARRKLTEALMKLEDVDDDLKGLRHRRPSGEMSPAKKLKPDEKERSSSSRRHARDVE
ncbi:hypothetical protein CONLIGDRAFT_683517 [Coniochaeta ligniaria NRRL 30616]|uniref:Aminoglycoside phosphotransferase domain-containing protein n=1 Tax=Coniochaeta ligniaria NRRL 30616 TaxID=1408157 RepID=A0A1J7IGZ7_9PEZI|nr:hypothetical protein CONLIGDRAFT_683517 [Coniochaeta ligniaria NRRL 30616]